MPRSMFSLFVRSGRANFVRATLLAFGGVFMLGAGIGVVHAQTPIEIDTTSVDFGMVNVGNTSPSMDVTLTNTDPMESFGPINMFGGAPPTPEFSASQNCQGVTLAPGETCNVSYAFTPSGPSVFNDTSNFTVSETPDQGDGEPFSVSLTGEGINPITAAPLSHDFGQVEFGATSAPMDTIITNTSADPFGPLNLFGGAPPTPEFGASQNCQGMTLSPGGSCNISYTFMPSGPGTFNDTSNFTVSGTPDQAAGVPFSVDLTGEGVVPISAAPLSHDFGDVTVGTTSGPMATVVTNNGAAPIGPISLFGGEPPSAEFTASQNCQGAVLAPGGTCSLIYTFSPSAPGDFTDTSDFTVSPTGIIDDGVAFSVDLMGVGLSPRATFLVEKDFTDDNPAEVDVTLSCNTGLPLEQTTAIAEGDPVNFVVGDYEPGTLDCEVSEAVPDGYTPSYDNGMTQTPDSCVYLDVVDGESVCTITNTLDPVEVAVTKAWVDDNPQFNAVNIADANWSCSNVASGASSGTLSFFGNLDTETFLVFPSWDDGTDCEVSEVSIPDGGVETDDSDCQSVVVFPGLGGECQIVNTRLYQGIPALNGLGLALLALMFALTGWVAFRRYG